MTEKNKDEIELTSIFITEGDSASGTITKARNAQTQAVFSLRGKPINCYKESRKKVAENEELNLLLNALGVEDDIANLRYNRIIVATDADDDGMHIRMLVLTFFMKYYPELIRNGHVYILQPRNLPPSGNSRIPKPPVSKDWVRFLPTSSNPSSGKR